MTYILDTHTLVWFLEANPRLSSAARQALVDPSTKLVVPTIVLAEVAFLYPRKRIAVGLQAVLARLTTTPNCVVYPLDHLVVERLPSQLDIHDAIIVATGLVFRDLLGESTAVITKDAQITNSGLVQVVW